MKTFSKFAAAAAAVSLAAVAVPASAATLISFATATPTGSPSLEYTVNAGGVGGTLNGFGTVNWNFDEVLDDASGLGPINTKFTLSATSSQALGTDGGVTGVAGFAGSFSFVYQGPDHDYTWYGLTRTLKSGDTLLSATFTNAWLQGTGSGSFNAATGGGVPAIFSSVTSDVFNFANATDYDFSFTLTGVNSRTSADGRSGGFSSPGLQQTANGKGFKSFRSGSTASFSAGAVPEPGTWALMIMGFGGAGAMLRRRRVVAA